MRTTSRWKPSKSILSETHPTVEAAVRCGRSGYRVTKLGTLIFGGTKVREQGTTVSKLRFSTAPSQIAQACSAGKKAVTLDIAVVAQCTKVKTAIGNTHYTPVGATTHVYDLACK